MASNSPLCFCANKKIMSVGKQFLSMLEDLVEANNRSKELLVNSISKFDLSEQSKDLLVAIIGQENTLSDSSARQIRKRILDATNEAARELTTEFDNYLINPRQ